MVRELSPSKQPKPALLTKARLAALKPGQRQRDSKVKGLFCERGERGWSMKVQTALRQPGKPVRTFRSTLAHAEDLGALDLEAIRNEAATVLAGVKSGVDPREPKAAPGQLTVRGMFEAYGADLTMRGAAERTIEDHAAVLARYLPALTDRAVADVKKSELRGEHARISDEHGKVAANKAMRAYRAAFNVALQQTDDPDALGSNPVDAIRLWPERRKEAVILPGDLRAWYARLQKVPSASRRIMHEIGLFSGLRPGSLMTLEKAWIQLDDRAIVIPSVRMKSRRDFALPLSEHLCSLVRRALVLSHEFASGSPWLFPTRSNDGREIIATQVIRERTMPSETGHILRHTHASMVRAAGIEGTIALLLSDHRVPGIEGVYVHAKALFTQLLEAQEKTTAHILSLIQPTTK